MKYHNFKNEPLPEHTHLDYYECLAKKVLEELFPDDFYNLEFADKPDLQNAEREIGIEVTRAVDQKEERIEKLYNKISHKQVRNKNKAIETINSSYISHSMKINGKEIKEPNRYNDGILGGYGQESFDLVLAAFKNKVIKLNEGGYSIFLHNHLFVYNQIFANQDMIDEVVMKMNTFQTEYERKFQKIFVYVPSYLYILNLLDKKGEIKYIKDSQFGWALYAREKVIEIERTLNKV